MDMSTDPTRTFGLERLKMKQDNLENELNFLRRQVVKLNLKLLEYERNEKLGGRSGLRDRVVERHNNI